MAANRLLTEKSAGRSHAARLCFRGKFFLPQIFLLALISLFLCGFVPLPQDILDKCRTVSPEGPARFRVAVSGQLGYLDVTIPGSHRFVPDRGVVMSDPGVEEPDFNGLKAFWRMLDLYSPVKAPYYGDTLKDAGVDFNTRGWVRLDPAGDHLGATIGSAGETQPDMPQAIFNRDTGRVVRVVMGDGSWAETGHFYMQGWPRWVHTSAGLIEFIEGPMTLDAPAVIFEREERTPGSSVIFKYQ